MRRKPRNHTAEIKQSDEPARELLHMLTSARYAA
jgi:hypothetical protein